MVYVCEKASPLVWNARKLDDRGYHQRRLGLSIVAILLVTVVLTFRLSDVAERGWSARDAIAFGGFAVLIAFCARTAASELQQLRHIARDGAVGTDALSGSNRTRVLFWIFSAVLAIAVALLIALLVSLGAHFIAGWRSAPVPQLVEWLRPVAVSLIGFRLALAWSMRRDRRKLA